MTQPVRKAILLGATALALVAAPMLLNQTGFSDIAAYAKDGNGNGGGNSDGGGSDNGGGNSDHGNSGGSESNSGGNGNGGNGNGGNGNGGGKEKKVATTEEVTSSTETGKASKTKNLNAQLAGLNSLNRNINGLMNSSDPRMEQIREFIEAGAALEAAQDELAAAEQTLAGLQAAFDEYFATAVSTADLTAYDGATVYDDPTLATLTHRLEDLDASILADPTTLEAMDEQEALAAVNDQQGVVDGLAEDVAELETATGEDALKDALIAAANKNRVAAAGEDAYLTPEIMDWATARLDSLTEAYIAQQ